MSMLRLLVVLSLLLAVVSQGLPLQEPPHVTHVFIVVIDGLRPEALVAAETPHLNRLMREGAFTLLAHTVHPSLTLPAHASLVSGVLPERHKILWDDYEPERGFIQVPTIFDVAHEAGLKTALFTGKRKLEQIACPGSVDRLSAEDRRDLDVMQEAVRYIAQDRLHLTLIHLPQVDLVGHKSGRLSLTQRQSVAGADWAVGLLLQTLEDTGLAQTSVVIVAANHGGHEFRHDTEDPRDMTIPWIIWGTGIEPQDLAPVQITDTAATALWALGLNVPSDWQGQPVLAMTNQLPRVRPAATPPQTQPEPEADSWISSLPSIAVEILPGVDFYSFVSMGDRYLFAGGLDGYVYRSEDGIHFERLKLQASRGSAVKSLYVDSRSQLFASGADTVLHEGYIYRSHDEGRSWEMIYRSSEWGQTSAAIGRWTELSDGTLLAGLYNDKTIPQAYVYASYDAGQTWDLLLNYTAVANQAQRVHNVFVDSDDHIYVSVGDADQAFLVSEDRGQTWRNIYDQGGFTGIAEFGDHLVLTPGACGAALSILRKGSDVIIPVLRPDLVYPTSCITFDVVQNNRVLLTVTRSSDKNMQAFFFASAFGGWTWVPIVRRAGFTSCWDLEVFRGYVYFSCRYREESQERIVARFQVPTREEIRDLTTRHKTTLPSLEP